MKKREMEEGIHTDLSRSSSYGGYLKLDQLLGAQTPLSDEHDEMLFIIQHQTSELWMKLVLHELEACQRCIRADTLSPAFKILARVGHIQQELMQQWSVLATLTPPEYLKFRPMLGHASGFQSYQYRAIEFVLGNKNAASLAPHEHAPEIYAWLEKRLRAPSVYDEFLCYLHRKGHAIPDALVTRDWSEPHTASDAVVQVFKRIYEDPHQYWAEYEMAEKLVDVEERFQLWRFRHLSTVRRIIGGKMGTGGSTGVGFLRKALDLCFFPELWEVRTILEAPAS